jgi:golgi phosphoprotein 3
MKHELTLKEKYLLLCYHPEKGRLLTAATWFDYGLAGAVMIELAAADKIRNENNKLIVINAKPTGDAALDLVLAKLQASLKIRSFKTWIGNIAQGKSGRSLRLLIRKDLMKKGIMTEVQKKALRIFPYQRYPQINVRPRRELIDDINKIVIRRQIGSKQMLLLLGLIGATQMTGSFFIREDRRPAKKRIKEIINSNEFARELNGTVASVQAAVAAALATTVLITTAASTSN